MKVRTLSVGQLGTNCYVVSDDTTAVVIDPGDEASRILAAIGDNTLAAVLLTHAHFDHMGALYDLVERTGAPVYCHADEAVAMTDGVRNLSALFGIPLRTVSTFSTLKEGDSVTFGDMTFTVLHTPGHTKGSCCYLSGNTLFSGDTLFCESVGRTDFPGGDVHAMRASLRRLLAMDGNMDVLPGHDCPTTIAHEAKYNPYIGQC